MEAEDTQRFLEGSPRIALQIARPFDRYLFIEKSQQKARRLKASLESDFPQLADRCQFEVGDSNVCLQRACRQWDWSGRRGVFFLDPFAMQVDWGTMEAIAATRTVDLWMLFPISAAQRLLVGDGLVPEEWQLCLDRLFGTQDWRAAFYERGKEADLFEGEVDRLRKTATAGKICQYYLERLRSAFPAVADKPYWLYNSKRTPLFVFCFAMANPGAKAQSLALRIARDILEAQDGP